MRSSIVALLTLFSLYSQAQKPVAAAAQARPAGMNFIKEQDLKSDIFTLAGDSMRGRRAGTPDELRAAAWVAKQAQKAGLKPAGDDGTYFQFYNLVRSRMSDNSTLQINSSNLKIWKDYWVAAPIEGRLDAPIVWINSLADTAKDYTGKIVAMNIFPPNPLPAEGMSLWGYRYIISALRQQGMALKNHGAIAALLIADAVTQQAIPFAGHNYEEGLYQLEGMPLVQPAMPVILLRQESASLVKQANSRISAVLHSETFLYPSVNVVAVAPGSDVRLRNEYVLFSGHHDHDGVGVPIAGDSIWNGADDNASVAVAMLAVGRAWVKSPAKRSALFVWHGAEERGLLGSRWYSAHPTVPKESIIAVLNGDMIGRNNVDSAALLGSTAPHRNSPDLVSQALKANAQFTKFKIDSSWDSPAHPEFWYFRSDHLPYARAGIPAIFFTSLLHPDYHTPKDEPQRIDMKKLYKMTQWIYLTGWLVANTPARPRVDPNFHLER